MNKSDLSKPFTDKEAAESTINLYSVEIYDLKNHAIYGEDDSLVKGLRMIQAKMIILTHLGFTPTEDGELIPLDNEKTIAFYNKDLSNFLDEVMEGRKRLKSNDKIH